jgi:hypothetical protein
VEEGVLRGHAFAEGAFQDVHVLAIYRERLTEYLDSRLAGLVTAVGG